ncbi:MAG: hypothetical protein ACK54P_15220, partial [Bacteroidota bacterium]
IAHKTNVAMKQEYSIRAQAVTNHGRRPPGIIFEAKLVYIHEITRRQGGYNHRSITRYWQRNR